ncbi:hypothetical protein M9978_02510 [Sphingomonas sp. MG17]|uniref:Uncharacterized protein n=1 Tax=Sphingomonas tagetis TaxID=2949092 RepID=A0A9X2HK52_9SPHN|nr:hypothetical protein [Sphingomonas tagetis]MCP3729289.1 hypothetical protein [Sphingomonas tagetis]
MARYDSAVDDVTAQLAEGKSLVPDHLWGGILNHVLEGHGTGSFLTHVFRNDLLNAATGADEVSLARLPDLMRFLHNYAPQSSWGTPKRVSRWREAGGIRGGAHELEDAE